MRSLKIFSVLFAFAIVFPSACFAGLLDNPRVAVIPFVYQGADKSIEVSEGILEDLRSIAETDIKNASGFKSPDRVGLSKILDELKLQRSGLFKPETIKKLGKFTGADYLTLGAVTSVSRDGGKYKAYVTLRMVEVETAEVALSGRGTGTASNLHDSLEKATEDALSGKRGILTMLILLSVRNAT